MKNVMLLLGRGIEGTGNTRITIELEEYLKECGYNAYTIASADKSWGREKAQENDFIMHKFSKDGVYSKYTETPDVCLIMSVPAKRKVSAKIKADPELLKEFEEEQVSIYEGFTKTLEELKNQGTKIIYLQVDHKIHSINRNYYALEEYTERFFKLLDKVITPNKNNDFMKKFVDKKVFSKYPEINFEVDEQLLISCDFDIESSKIGFVEKIPSLCYYIGRSARWKGWTVFRDFHYNKLKDAGFISIIEGIELSYNGKEDLYYKDETTGKFTTVKESNIDYIADKENTPEFILSDIIMDRNKYLNRPAMIFGPYNREAALKRLAKAKFGMFFSYLGEEYSGPLEIAFLEMVAAGTVPVIRKDLYETAQFNGDRLSNYKPEEIGLIIYDEEHSDDCVNVMKTLDYSNELYRTYLNRVTSFCKTNFDRKVILKRVLDLINIV